MSPAPRRIVLVSLLLLPLPAAGADSLPVGAVARLGSLRFRHAETVCALAFTPDSRQLLTGNANTTVYVLRLP